MSSVPQAASIAGPVFMRLVARMVDADPVTREAPLAATLAQWIDWPRAVVLAGALDRPPDASNAVALDAVQEPGCMQLRGRLRDAIAADPLLAAVGETPADGAADFAPFRACYLAHQRAMLAATGRLRGQLRDMLAARPASARLAEIDAALEQALAPREHALLSGVPDLLAAHFERLRDQAHRAGAGRPAWLDRFRLDMRELLLAELDLRFSPVDALLGALGTPEPTR